MGRLFGTDGVRGVANTELSAELAFNLGFYGAKVLAGHTDHRPRLLVGHDGRISAGMLEAALSAGITASGADVYSVGLITTPGVAYLTRTQNFDAGVMISASHNSFEFNGIKFFNSQGYKLSDEIEDEIEAAIAAAAAGPAKTGADLGRRYDYDKGHELYLAYLKDTCGPSLTGLKIVLDCANGAASQMAPVLFKDLGADLQVLAAEPDGININRDCGSTHLDALRRAVVDSASDLGIAFDGDADRMLAVDANGDIVDGDKIMLLVASDLRRQGKLPHDTLVVTVMSNLGLHRAAAEMKLNLATTKVGDRYVLEEMLDKGYGFGGEQSGHLILSAYSTTGDGMLSALVLLAALQNQQLSLVDVQKLMHVYPQVLVPAFIPNENKSKAMADPQVCALIDRINEQMGGVGRVLVRPSGTEPQVRVMLEGDDLDLIQGYAEEIANLIVERFG